MLHGHVFVMMTPTETWKKFCDNDNRKTCFMTIIFDWHQRFLKGRADISDDFRSGRPHISDSAMDILISASRYMVPE